MFRVQFILVACLAMTVLTQEGSREVASDVIKSLLVDSTQESSESSQNKTDPAKEERIQAEVAEIMAIRKQLGGGVSEQLKGFSIEMPGKKQSVEVPDADQRLVLEEAFAKNLAEQSRNSVAVPTGNGKGWHLQDAPGSGRSPEQRETVRHAARMLEEAAAILEEAKEYDRADSIRQTAGELWRSARHQ